MSRLGITGRINRLSPPNISACSTRHQSKQKQDCQENPTMLVSNGGSFFKLYQKDRFQENRVKNSQYESKFTDEPLTFLAHNQFFRLSVPQQAIRNTLIFLDKWL